MFDIVYEFFCLAGLETPPATLAELIPYVLQFLVALALVLAAFRLVSGIAQFFFNGRWFR